MKDLITEARELCEKWSLSDYAVFECEDCIANMAIYKVVELCDALESLQADITERDEHIDFLHGEMIELVRESFSRTRALAKLEGEIERLRDRA